MKMRPPPDVPFQLTGGARFDELTSHFGQKQAVSGRKAINDDEVREFKYETPEEQRDMHMNVLFIFDDVVGDIKKREAEADMAALFFNRRHLISNGTVSIMLVTQKYTLIPARLRSSANWLVLFRLNPIDFENVYKDVIIIDNKLWQQLLDYVFKANEIGEGGGGVEKRATVMSELKKKRFDNLGIWVEFDVYFKNFERIVINKSHL